MPDKLNARRPVPAFLSGILAALLVAGCGGESGAPASGTDEARRNVEAMAREHAADTSDPSPGTLPAPRREVVGERLPYAEINDELVYGYFVFPADMIEPLPAILVIHEWWGLNDNVRTMSERLAGEGYIVLAVDLYGGKTADSPGAARELMTTVVEKPTVAEENIRSAHDFLTATAGAPAVASLGWCFGGGWSLNAAALLGGELDAAVIYYGQVTADDEKLKPVEAEILGLFGAADRGISVDSVRAFEAALERLDKPHEIHVYPGAGHAFANPTGNNYDAEAAADAWARTLAFLARTLNPAD
ncbi:MAG: dienelactone hydrolase family protein [Woeseiaceae bacterium]|nr:dienelactone hydrolase family protein [Woeseiaceae bacterium]